MNYLIQALIYVVADPYFYIAMGMTTAVGMFIGSVLYDGLIREVIKAIVVLVSYALLVAMTNISRVLPFLPLANENNINQPLAGTMTILLVTIFYLIGMYLGVLIIRQAHPKHKKL